MAPQQTLRETVELSGVGLHSGRQVNMTFQPAPANAGIVFRRVDLEGRPEIPARLEHVHETNRSTTLSKGAVKVQTVEHVLAAFAGSGVDNAVVELDANEPPIGDGSARAYCDMIRRSGIEPQNVDKEIYPVREPIELEAGESVLSVFPYNGFKITCASADRQGRFAQVFSTEIDPAAWEKELAHARTFCFFEEIEHLIKNGLIKGGSLENAVVIREDAVLTTEPLRYPDEFVRHKILDILGDLTLLGRPILGHVVAVRPGHAANCELAKRIKEQMDKPLVAARAFGPPPPSDNRAGNGGEPQPMPKHPPFDPESGLDLMQIMQILPHRYPFLMMDRVLKIEGNKVTALKNVTFNEGFFQGHFPGHPVMPGVLQLEAIAQVAGLLMLMQAENAGKIAYFMSAESVKWRKPVRPGDCLIIQTELLKMRGKIGKAKGVCKVQEEIVSQAEVTFTLADR